MTTTRSKSVGRAADAARRAKHDQRTPLPAKGAKPVGNPAAEAIADEVAKTPRKRTPRKAAAPAVETPAPVAAVEASGGDALVGDSLAATVKERRDAGDTWRAISEALALGPGKTGTSRARRLYKAANDGASAPRKEPKARSSRRAASPYADGMDSTEGERPASRSRAAQMPMVALDRFRLAARDTRTKKERGTRPKMGDVNTATVGQQQITGLRRLFEADGYTVTVEKQQADGTWATVA